MSLQKLVFSFFLSSIVLTGFSFGETTLPLVSAISQTVLPGLVEGKTVSVSNRYSKAVLLFEEGVLKYEEENFSNALLLFGKAIEMNSNFYRAYFRRGEVLYELEDYRSAIEDFDSGLRIDPNDENAYVTRSYANYQLENYPSALADINKALQLNPMVISRYRHRGHVYLMLSNYNQAIADYTKCIESEPDNAAYRFNRIDAYMKAKEYDKAIYELDRLVFKEPTADKFNYRGVAYFRKRNFKAAFENFNKAIEAVSTNGHYFSNRGYVYMWKKNYALAKADFEKAYELDHKCPETLKNLGIYYWVAEKNFDKSLHMFQSAFDAGFVDFGRLYREERDGHFLKKLNKRAEFLSLIRKYQPDFVFQSGKIRTTEEVSPHGEK